MDKCVFTEQELKENVRVPAIVEAKLKAVVEKCLTRCGVYHQIISRIKTHHSLAKKYQRKSYNENKKIQDLIGLRIDVYFEDDLKLCRTLLETLFGEAEWSFSNNGEEEFKPAKINGVFKFPPLLKNMIAEETWNYYIDDTFEIQLKTVFFEGWHEIEHDMKYKDVDLWSGKHERNRYFNTILATLELCDKSIVTLFENLGHDLYHERKYAGMMKAHFRIKMRNTDLHPEIKEYFDKDDRVDNIPKRIFKTNREDLVFALLGLSDKVEINVNTIVAVLNDKYFHDAELAKITNELDVYGLRSPKSFDDEYKYDLRLPEFMSTFHADVILKDDGTNLDSNFEAAVATIYSWMYNKYSAVFPQLSKNVESTTMVDLGFNLEIKYEPENRTFTCVAKHIDEVNAGRLWVTSAYLFPQEDGKNRLSVDNGFTYYPNANDKAVISNTFSCPRFYRQIATQIGVIDIIECGNIHCALNNEAGEELARLIMADGRTFPVVLIASDFQTPERLDESWLGNFAIRYIQEKAGHYAHFARMHMDVGQHIIKLVKESGFAFSPIKVGESDIGIAVVHPKRNGFLKLEWFDENYIGNCDFTSFDAIEHLQPFKEMNNGRAFGNELLQVLRRINTDYNPYKVK